MLDEFLFFLGLLGLGYFAGIYFEKKHYQSLQKRECQTYHVPMVTFGAKQTLPEAKESALFMGSVVISADYFKMFIASLMNLFGGRIVVYESLLERGRREARLRMKEEAIAWGATQILNVRLETTNISSQFGSKGTVAIEVMAYGTGIRLTNDQ